MPRLETELLRRRYEMRWTILWKERGLAWLSVLHVSVQIKRHFMNLSDIQYHLHECDLQSQLWRRLWRELLISVKRGAAVLYATAAGRRGFWFGSAGPKRRDGSFQKAVLRNMRLDLLVFWSKDNVVREESMISADSTSPAGGGSGWVIQSQLFYFDAARVEAANSRNGKPADFKLMLGVYAFRGMLLGVGTGVTCYNYSDKRILVLSLAHCAYRGIITRLYSTIESPNSKTDGLTSEPTTIFHIMIQIVIEHKTAQPTSYNPCFLCISLFWVAICISLLLLPSLTPDSTTVALRYYTKKKPSQASGWTSR
ncbi:hypothetical protein DER44DRAFT_738626 [Fusarium oxysporum]|nr:hypothetical protein DER44DRAFT_738626 [Fusarium oxysporum]